jgi:transposase
MYVIGMDVHQRSSSLCILDAQGQRVKEKTLRGSWREAVAWLAQLEQPFAICYEASCGYGALYEALRPIAQRVVVAHPGHLRLIFRSQQKHDRVDARKLAMLLLVEQVPTVWVPPVPVRQWRRLIEARQRAIGRRTRIKNGLRTLLRGEGIEPPRGGSLWTRRGRAWLGEVALPEAAALERDVLLEELAVADMHVGRLTRQLDRLARQDRRIALLRTIPGVGPRTAEAVVAYLDDVRRFGRINQVGSYAGLVPRQDSSGSTQRLGHITRQGPPTLRKLLVEVAWQAKRRSPTIRRRFERLTGGRRERRKVAIVAVAHYLLRVMASMLRTGESWREAA